VPLSKAEKTIHTAPLGSIVTSSPLELKCVDFLHLDTCSGDYEYLLVITDHFTRFSQAYPARNKSSTTAANIIFNNFICRFGIPSRILHDQGKEWENKIFEQLEKLCGMTKSRTSPYHPMGNGQCERMNQTLLAMLKTLPEAWKSNWKDHVNKLIFAYNCTSNSVTGYSPYYLLFGRQPRLPIDAILPRPELSEITPTEYSKRWKHGMEEAYKVVAQKTAERKVNDKIRHDQRPHLGKLCVGDRVLVRNLSERGGTGKLRSF